MPVARATDTVTVCVPDFEPWGMIKQDVVQGIMLDQVKAILAEVKLKTKADFANYPRMIQRIRSGDCDIGAFSRYESNADAVEFIEHLYDLQVVAVTPKNVTIKDFESFHDLKLIPSVGFPMGGDEFFPRLFNDPKIVKEMVPAQHHGVLMLGKGRLGAFVGIDKTIVYEARNNHLEDKLNLPGFPVNKLQIWLQISKKAKTAMKYSSQIREAAKKLKKEGRFNAIIDAWVSQ